MSNLSEQQPNHPDIRDLPELQDNPTLNLNGLSNFGINGAVGNGSRGGDENRGGDASRRINHEGRTRSRPRSYTLVANSRGFHTMDGAFVGGPGIGGHGADGSSDLTDIGQGSVVPGGSGGTQEDGRREGLPHSDHNNEETTHTSSYFDDIPNAAHADRANTNTNHVEAHIPGIDRHHQHDNYNARPASNIIPDTLNVFNGIHETVPLLRNIRIIGGSFHHVEPGLSGRNTTTTTTTTIYSRRTINRMLSQGAATVTFGNDVTVQVVDMGNGNRRTSITVQSGRTQGLERLGSDNSDSDSDTD